MMVIMSASRNSKYVNHFIRDSYQDDRALFTVVYTALSPNLDDVYNTCIYKAKLKRKHRRSEGVVNI